MCDCEMLTAGIDISKLLSNSHRLTEDNMAASGSGDV